MGLLDSMLGSSGPRTRGGGMSALAVALIGLLAYRTFQGKGGLGEMLGRKAEAEAGTPSVGHSSQAAGELGGLLGGGAAGGILSQGLVNLLSQFEQAGHGDKAQSWIGAGSNEPVAPSELEQVLGSEKTDWLAREAGISREELLTGLSRELPRAVDKLTPHGRLPTA